MTSTAAPERLFRGRWLPSSPAARFCLLVVPYLRMRAALGLWNACGEAHAIKNGVSVGEDGGGREEEDVSHHDAEFNHHTVAKPTVSDLLKTMLCLLKNVSDFVACVGIARCVAVSALVYPPCRAMGSGWTSKACVMDRRAGCTQSTDEPGACVLTERYVPSLSTDPDFADVVPATHVAPKYDPNWNNIPVISTAVADCYKLNVSEKAAASVNVETRIECFCLRVRSRRVEWTVNAI
ncbi:hypothetical protein K438DRAFT_1787333 [Mycena galopus ATCC 62051]|nr:hypothetical protein K438DRAFT_1787333 [Mycena galopus ATCC 62051]